MSNIKPEDRDALANSHLVNVSKQELSSVQTYFDTLVPMLVDSLVAESVNQLQDVRNFFSIEVQRLEDKLDEALADTTMFEQAIIEITIELELITKKLDRIISKLEAEVEGEQKTVSRF